MDRRYKPLLPAKASSEKPSPQPQGSTQPITPDITIPPKRAKRHGTGRSACDSCRARKTACDSQRPTCSACRKRETECVYTMASGQPSEEGLQAMESLRRENDNLKSSAEIVDQLKSLPEQDALDLLKRLREASEPSNAITLFEEPIHERSAAPHLVPPTQSSLEFELMIRHPISYPTLVPTELPFRNLEHLLGSVGTPGYIPARRSKRTAEVLDAPPDSSSDDASALRSGFSSEGAFGGPTSTLCEPSLRHLQIRKWTKVAITDELAANVISYYLETDHPLLGLFDADLFVKDLVSGQQHFCSSLLVNALLSWACQGYSHIDPDTSAMSFLFFEEAEGLWFQERRVELLTTVAASQFLNLAASCHGREAQSVAFLKEGIQMGRRMGLFGVPAAGSAQQWLDDHTDWVKAASHTAWGVFCWVTFRCLHFQTGQIESPPHLPMPGDERSNDDKGKARQPHPLPPYMGQTFPRMCVFWSIVHDIVWNYYDGEDRVAPASRAHFEFAESKYQKLLEWADELPLELARGNENTHHVVIAHIYYHAAIIDLFRPFLLDNVSRNKRLRSFSAPDSTPEAVYVASVNQLKRLILVYMTNFASTSYTFLWHTALLYVANATLRDAPNGDWREWFQVCLAGYENLLGSFRVAGTIAQGLLAMAIRNRAMATGEAGQMVQQLKAKAAAFGNGEDGRGSLIVDLDLAMTNPLDAQVGSLAARLNELVLFQEFTTTEEER